MPDATSIHRHAGVDDEWDDQRERVVVAPHETIHGRVRRRVVRLPRTPEEPGDRRERDEPVECLDIDGLFQCLHRADFRIEDVIERLFVLGGKRPVDQHA
jgi:hypothetical protein